MNADLSVYLVTDAVSCARAGRDVVATVREAVAGGVTAVQVREKHITARDFLDLVTAVAATLPRHVALLVNDRVDVFLAAGAAGARVTGVHVGQHDLPTTAVRALVGPRAVVGLSASTPEQLAAAERDGADYVGIGALRDTPTKPDAPAGLGHERWAALAAATRLPAVAIGGVTVADVPRVRSAGGAGVAVVSAVCAAADARAAAASLADAWAAGPGVPVRTTSAAQRLTDVPTPNGADR